MSQRYDFAIVGAGMAGASLAAELAPHGSVVLLEAEDQPGYHATGRSAAFWDECYGGPDIVPLTHASGDYLRSLHLLRERGSLYLARACEEDAVAAFLAEFAGSLARVERVGRTELASKVPGLRAEWDRGVWQPRCADIDVAGLHAHYLKTARAGGAQLRTRTRLTGAVRSGDGWNLAFGQGEGLWARTLVNAAGAWADDVARLASLSALGITPLRRTVAQLRTDPPPPDSLPLCIAISGAFYFKPDNGKLWLSPHDETPSPALDAAPEEIDVATAIERFGSAVDWRVEAVERKWAGLRSFAPDRLPVYGRDPREPSFAWFAGQGGYGIQTAPAAARLMAQHLLNLPSDAMTSRLDIARYGPRRLI